MSECYCRPVFLPFHDDGRAETFWSAYCPSCKNELKWDVNIKTKKEAINLWVKTFGVRKEQGE